MQLQPYLFFNGHFDEALAFYRTAVGAELVMLVRFRESPDQSNVTPETADKVMHAKMQIGGAGVMASDGNCSGEQQFGGFALSLTADSDADAQRAFAALGDGGRVVMPMAGTFYASCFGMLVDRFGVTWMVMAGLQS